MGRTGIVVFLCAMVFFASVVDTEAKHKNHKKHKKHKKKHHTTDIDTGLGNLKDTVSEILKPAFQVMDDAFQQECGGETIPLDFDVTINAAEDGRHLELGIMDTNDNEAWINIEMGSAAPIEDSLSWGNLHDICEFGAHSGGDVVTHEISEEDVHFAYEAILAQIEEDENGPLQHDCGNDLHLTHPHHTPETGHTEVVAGGYIKTFQITVHEEHFIHKDFDVTVSIFVDENEERSLQTNGVYPEPCSITAPNHEGDYNVCADDFHGLSAEQQKMCRMHSMFEHNKNSEKTWKRTYYKNMMENMRTKEDVFRITGAMDASLTDEMKAKLPRGLTAEQILSSSGADMDIPASYNFFDEYPQCFFSAPSQSGCGSCWAFATTGAFEKNVCKRSVDNGFELHKPRLSRQQVVECGTSAYACNGGWATSAYYALASAGGIHESCHPYTSGNTNSPAPDTPLGNDYCVADRSGENCDKKYTNVPVAGFESEWNSASWFDHPWSALRADGEEAIKAAILAYGPVYASFTVYSDFFGYASGIYIRDPNASEEGGHAVQIIGWGTDENGVDYWIIENSWGDSWGENRNLSECGSQICNGDWCILSSEDDRASQCGYYRMRRGTNEAGIEDGAFFSNVDLADLGDGGDEDPDDPPIPDPDTPTCEGDDVPDFDFWGEDPYEVEYEVTPLDSVITAGDPFTVEWRAPISRSKDDVIAITNSGECVPLDRQYVDDGHNGCHINGQTTFYTGDAPAGTYDVAYVSVRPDNVGSVRAAERSIATFVVEDAPTRTECDASSCSHPSWAGDGYCDAGNNVAECCYDAGDCCESTCVDATYTCGSNGYTCENPHA